MTASSDFRSRPDPGPVAATLGHGRLLRSRWSSALAALTAFALGPDSSAQADELTPRGDPELGALLAAVHAGHEAPALAAALVRGDDIIAAVIGRRRAGDGSEVELEDRFHWGSLTKSMTAVVAATMVEEGDLSWQVPVTEALGIRRPNEALRKVTLRDLLEHHGGLRANATQPLSFMVPEPNRIDRGTRMELARTFLQSPPEHEPGTEFHYSNLGYIIAGTLLEQVSDQSIESLIEERIYRPLEMTNSGFGAPASGQRDPESQPWGHGADGIPVPPGPGDDNPAWLTAAGRAHGCVTDLARYARFHLRCPPGQIYRHPATIRDLQRARENSKESAACGWFVRRRDWASGQVFTHNGSNTMFYAVVWVAPEIDTALVALGNIGGEPGAKAADAACKAMIDVYIRGRR